jgi:hypothetical protein
MVAEYTDPKPVRRAPLRVAYARATICSLVALVTAQPAAAHLVVQPSILERGETVEVAVELPRLREGAPPERLDVDGDGVDVVSSRRQEVLGDGETRFTVRLRANVPPGRLPVVLRAGFAGGETVEIDTTLTVVPGEESGPPVVAIAIGAVVALAVAAAALAVARRRA